MPLFNHQHINNNLTVAIWHIKESLEDLQEQVSLREDERKRMLYFASVKRKLEWLTVRLMVQTIQPDNCEIHYNENGRPYLKGSQQSISISHSFPYVCVTLNNNQFTGVDIQVNKPNITKGKSLFLNAQDLACLGNKCDEKDLLHIAWCAKEAMYKYTGNKALNIYEHFTLQEIRRNEKMGSIKGWCGFSKNAIAMRYQKHADFFLVFTI